jgi:hypothetical protein
MHQHMHIPHQDSLAINGLRREQGLLNDSWDGVLSQSDPAIHGALILAKSEGLAPPKLGYSFRNSTSEIDQFVDAAWTEKKLGIVVRPEIIDVPPGWTIKSISDIQSAGSIAGY